MAGFDMVTKVSRARTGRRLGSGAVRRRGSCLMPLVLAVAGSGCGATPTGAPPPPARPAIDPAQARIQNRTYSVSLIGAGGSVRGSTLIRIDSSRDEVCWAFSALVGVPAPLYAHIHRGVAAVAGPIVIPLGGPYRPAGCMKDIGPGLLAQIESEPRAFYVNVHDAAHPAGAVRGQL